MRILKGQNLKTKQEVQIKRIQKKDRPVHEIESLRIQIEMYKLSMHPYVVRLLDYFEDKEYIYLITEKHQGMSLNAYNEANHENL